jgi:hypothetical protein
VKRPVWQVSQLRRRVPCATPSGSSTMSKQWQVGQTAAQAPQPWQRSASPLQIGWSKCASSQERIAVSGRGPGTGDRGPTSALPGSSVEINASGAGLKRVGWAATSSPPLGVTISTT